MPLPPPDPGNGYLLAHARLLLCSYARWTNRALVDPKASPREQARLLYHAPFAVLSHNTDPDPLFTYGNQAALRLFELTWEELTQMPSRKSAEPLHRSERERLLAGVAARGYVADYRGVRISKTGKRFLIEQATVWNLLDDSGTACGQAATFSNWTPLP